MFAYLRVSAEYPADRWQIVRVRLAVVAVNVPSLCGWHVIEFLELRRISRVVGLRHSVGSRR